MTYYRTEHLQVLFDKHFSLLNVSERAVMTGWLENNRDLKDVAISMKVGLLGVTILRDSAVEKLRDAEKNPKKCVA